MNQAQNRNRHQKYEPKDLRPRLWLIPIGFLIVIGIINLISLFLTDYSTGFPAIPQGTMVLGFLFLTLSSLAFAIAWRALLRDKISIPQAFLKVKEAGLLKALFSISPNQVIASLLVHLTSALSFWEVLASSLLHWVFLSLLNLVLFLIFLPSMPPIALDGFSGMVRIGLYISALIFFYLLASRSQAITAQDHTGLPRAQQVWGHILKNFTLGLTILKQPRKVLTAAAWLLAGKAFSAAATMTLLKAIVSNSSLTLSSMLNLIPALRVFIPFNQYLVFENTTASIFPLFGYTNAQGLTYALTTSLINVAMVAVFAIIGLLWDAVILWRGK